MFGKGGLAFGVVKGIDRGKRVCASSGTALLFGDGNPNVALRFFEASFTACFGAFRFLHGTICDDHELSYLPALL